MVPIAAVAFAEVSFRFCRIKISRNRIADALVNGIPVFLGEVGELFFEIVGYIVNCHAYWIISVVAVFESPFV